MFEMIGYRRIIEEQEESTRWTLPSSHCIDLLLTLPLRAADVLETELAAELENARIVRLLCKMNFITDRPGSVFRSSSISLITI